MTEPILEVEVAWRGPFAWPGFEPEASLPPVPQTPGVYLQAFQSLHGFVLYGAGITKRPVRVRLREHTPRYLNGDYTILDVVAAQRGERREIWHGWGYARSHRDEFDARKEKIQEHARRQLAGYRIFIADPEIPGQTLRLRERLEAAVMDALYQQTAPHCDLPDRGMFLARRRASEFPVRIRNVCEHLLLGLPTHFVL